MWFLSPTWQGPSTWGTPWSTPSRTSSSAGSACPATRPSGSPAPTTPVRRLLSSLPGGGGRKENINLHILLSSNIGGRVWFFVLEKFNCKTSISLIFRNFPLFEDFFPSSLQVFHTTIFFAFHANWLKNQQRFQRCSHFKDIYENILTRNDSQRI